MPSTNSADIEEILGPDLIAAATELDVRIVSVQEVTRRPRRGSQRACFRLELDDGRILKGRRFRSVERCVASTALRPTLGGLAFAQLLCAKGCATIEEWIHGASLDPGHLKLSEIQGLARTFGTLHEKTRFTPSPERPGRNLAWYTKRLRRQITQLVEMNLIGTAEATSILGRAAVRETPSLEQGVIHTDFHPGNMVQTASGEVWTIDNEDLREGPLDYDLARSWRQWPLSDVQRRAFADAYGEFRSIGEFLSREEFWAVCTLVNTLHIHADDAVSTQQRQRELKQFADRSEESLWASRSDVQSK